MPVGFVRSWRTCVYIYHLDGTTASAEGSRRRESDSGVEAPNRTHFAWRTSPIKVTINSVLDFSWLWLQTLSSRFSISSLQLEASRSPSLAKILASSEQSGTISLLIRLSMARTSHLTSSKQWIVQGERTRKGSQGFARITVDQVLGVNNNGMRAFWKARKLQWSRTTHMTTILLVNETLGGSIVKIEISVTELKIAGNFKGVIRTFPHIYIYIYGKNIKSPPNYHSFTIQPFEVPKMDGKIKEKVLFTP